MALKRPALLNRLSWLDLAFRTDLMLVSETPRGKLRLNYHVFMV